MSIHQYIELLEERDKLLVEREQNFRRAVAPYAYSTELDKEEIQAGLRDILEAMDAAWLQDQ